ncbi:MAG: hypothetical protein RBU30_15715 [Polyangia bacterium]|jgi:GMP synthase-like glutamine amidotransferase|nr:hypothetical protein [Polyangia bacterium]
MSPPSVLILDLSVDVSLYRPVEHWRALLGDAPSRALRPADFASAEALLGEAGGFSHLIVTGSEASVVEPQAWFGPAEALIRQAVEARRAVLGSCFGHQLIARALLGPRHVRRAAMPELGWLPVTVCSGEPPFDGAEPELWMFSCHFDEVCELPPSWRVLGRTESCQVHAYAIEGLPVWGVQAHPEIAPQEGEALLRGFADRRPELAPFVDRILSGPRRDDGFGARLVARFLEVPA